MANIKDRSIEIEVQPKVKFSWGYFLAKMTSRKFLTALAAEVGLLVGLFSGYGETAESAVVRVGTIAGMVLVAVGYGYSEAKADSAREGSKR